MRMYPREFPSKPPQDSRSGEAERRVYEALAGSDRRGFVLLRVAQRLRSHRAGLRRLGQRTWAASRYR